VVEEKRTIEKMWALAEEKMTCDDQHKRTSETSQHQAMEMKVVRMEEQINALLRKWVVGWVVGWLVGWLVGWVVVVFLFCGTHGSLFLVVVFFFLCVYCCAC
jgi:hypothetical protein